MTARVGNHLHKLPDGWDVQFLHFLLHHFRGEGGHAWQGAEDGRQREALGVGHAHGGVADGGDLDLVLVFLQHRVEAEEGEEEVGLDALHTGAVGHDEAGIDAIERAAGDDDGDFFDFIGRRHGDGGLMA